MVFSSIIFLFLFLPLVLTLYHVVNLVLNRINPGFAIRAGNFFLLLCSLLFYTWGEKWFVLVMLTSTLVDYICGLVIAGRARTADGDAAPLEKSGKRGMAQKSALVISIATNLSILGFFKYFNFGIDNFNAFVELVGLEQFRWSEVMEITLPLGISFYTFQSLSYTIDVYRGDTKATRNLFDFACFVTLFPQLVAGPIVRYRDIATQLVARVITREDFSYGIQRFILGLGKKVLVANTVAVAADGIFALPGDALTPELAWLGVICYTLQIYFDFSGYSDMAIGLGRMFGFRFLENFNFPYIASSIQEFWRRWHMSLSRWFRDYLYIPLGGSRGGLGRTFFNLVMVFFLCGLWHGASWTFVVWGLFHGSFLMVERMGLGAWLARRAALVRHLYVLLVVMAGWVFFRSETFSQAISFFSAMIGLHEGTREIHYVELFLRTDLICALIAGVLFSMPVAQTITNRWKSLTDNGQAGRAAVLEVIGRSSAILVLCLVLFASILCLSSGVHNPFIYFRF